MNYRLVASTFLLFIASLAQAQNRQSITFEYAIKTAVDNNLNIKQAENTLLLRETQVLSEKMDVLPSLDGSSLVNRSAGFQFNQLTGQLGEFTTLFFNAQISAGVTVFAGLQNLYQLRAAEENLLSQSASLQRAREDVIFNTASTFLQVLLDRQLLEIQQKNLESAQKQLEQIQAQVEVGAVPQVDLFNQESNVAAIELQVIQRENALKFDEVRLIRQLQIDPSMDYEVVAPTIDENKINVKTRALQDLLAEAYQNRADLKAQESAIEASRNQLRASRAAFVPRLTAGFNYGSDFNDQIRDFDPEATFNEQFFRRNPSSSLNMRLSIPIFQNWTRKTQEQSSLVQYRNAQLELENRKLQVLQEIRQAYNDYTNFAQQVQSTRKAFQAAERAYVTEQERYRVGASTLIELTRAQATYVESEANKAQALYNFVFQEVLLDYFLGKITADVSLQSYQ